MNDGQKVHAMRAGQSYCGMAGPPKDWPPGHVWAGSGMLQYVNCPECKAILDAEREEDAPG